MPARTLRTVPHSRNLALLGLALLATMLLSLAGALPASAHSTLISATPEDGATLDEPPEAVVLTFNEDVTDLGSDIVVTGPNGDEATAGETTIDGPEISRPLADDLPAGEYTITWRAVSADGHPISGEFTFTLTEAAGAGQDGTTGEQSQTATSSPTEDAPSGTDAGADSSADNGASSDAGDTADDGTSAGQVALFVVIALAVIGFIITLIIRMRRQQ